MKEYSINEIAELTGKTVKFVRREVASGSLKSYKKGNKTLITEEDYNEWKTTMDEKYNSFLESADFSKSSKINKEKKKNDIINWIDNII